MQTQLWLFPNVDYEFKSDIYSVRDNRGIQGNWHSLLPGPPTGGWGQPKEQKC